MSEPGADLAPASAPSPRSSRPCVWWLVLTGRAVVFALAAAGSAFALLGAGREAGHAAMHYRCPMHPDAVSSEPSVCPICGMALVPDDRARGAVAAHAAESAPRVARATRRSFAEQVRAPAWAEASGAVVAVLYRDDAVGLAADQPAQFFAATAPSLGVDVVMVDQSAPPWDSATVRARFQVAGAAARPGDEGSLVIPGRPRELVVVPTSAILTASDETFVFVVDPASHRDVRRTVRIGREHQGVTAVLSGLSEGEEVVVGDAFFVAAEHSLHLEEVP